MVAFYNCSTCGNSWKSYRVDGRVKCRKCSTEVWPEESDDSDSDPDKSRSDVSGSSSPGPSEYECNGCGNKWTSERFEGWLTCRRCNAEVWPHNKSSPVYSECSDDEAAACYKCSHCNNKWRSYRVNLSIQCRDCGRVVWPYKRRYVSPTCNLLFVSVSPWFYSFWGGGGEGRSMDSLGRGYLL